MASLGDLLWIAALGGLFYYMMSKGGGCCGGHDHQGYGQDDQKSQGSDNVHSSHQNRSREQNPAESPAVQDPVCGMQVDNGPSAPVSEHLGRTFHFCSEQCRKLFEINPGKYAGSV